MMINNIIVKQCEVSSFPCPNIHDELALSTLNLKHGLVVVYNRENTFLIQYLLYPDLNPYLLI